MSGKVLTVLGARPQFVKAAPVSKAIAMQSDITELIVHTGQHYDTEMSEIFFTELRIPQPAYNLGIQGGGHGLMTGRMLEAIEGVIEREKPNILMVYGDTNSTLAGALAAAKQNIPIAHVESGLRSYNRRMPEEINRVVTDHLSSLLICPTSASVENLAAEGVTEGVHNVGDVMFDAVLMVRDIAMKRSSILQKLNVREGNYDVATVHRAENTDSFEALEEVISYLKKQAEAHMVVLPLHPRTKAAVLRFGLDLEGLMTCPPLGYLDMTRLVMGASKVMTDSGGLQKEAYFHKKPCITLRNETEWVETVQCGWNQLWKHPIESKKRTLINEYGDGDASAKIIALLHQLL